MAQSEYKLADYVAIDSEHGELLGEVMRLPPKLAIQIHNSVESERFKDTEPGKAVKVKVGGYPITFTAGYGAVAHPEAFVNPKESAVRPLTADEAPWEFEDPAVA